MEQMGNPRRATDIELSKKLSWLLRHGAHKEGLVFDDGGFIDVDNILTLRQFRNYSLDDIIRVVNENDKKRFSLRSKNDSDNVLQIRANQGHSLKIDEKGLLTLLSSKDIPPVIYHGTYLKKLNSIKAVGLSRMNRVHIHFTPNLPGETEVISGMRKNCEVYIAVDTIKAIQDGFTFYLSCNGVVLCPGNDSGLLPPFYFKEIWQISPLKRLF